MNDYATITVVVVGDRVPYDKNDLMWGTYYYGNNNNGGTARRTHNNNSIQQRWQQRRSRVDRMVE